MTSFNLSYFLKALSPDAVTLEVGIGGGHDSSIAGAFPCLNLGEEFQVRGLQLRH